MKKYRTETIIEQKTQQVLDTIVCNKCGGEFIKGEISWRNNNEEMEFHYLGCTGGYYSKIGDGLNWFIDLCDDCVIELIATCKIPPTFKAIDGIYTMMPIYEKDYDIQKESEEWLKKKRKELEKVE